MRETASPAPIRISWAGCARSIALESRQELVCLGTAEARHEVVAGNGRADGARPVAPTHDVPIVLRVRRWHAYAVEGREACITGGERRPADLGAQLIGDGDKG